MCVESGVYVVWRVVCGVGCVCCVWRARVLCKGCVWRERGVFDV